MPLEDLRRNSSRQIPYMPLEERQQADLNTLG